MKANFKETLQLNDLWKIAAVITNKISNAVKMNPKELDRFDTGQITEEWFDYLEEELIVQEPKETTKKVLTSQEKEAFFNDLKDCIVRSDNPATILDQYIIIKVSEL